MNFCGCLLLSFLLSIAALHGSVGGFRVQHQPAQTKTYVWLRTRTTQLLQQQDKQMGFLQQAASSTSGRRHVDGPASRPPAALWPRPGGVKAGEELTAKLLRLDDLVRIENDVMEPKRKRSFPGNNAPLDRLSASSMETKKGTNKQSKAVELPRRRVNPPPVDRIGMSRLPNSRG